MVAACCVGMVVAGGAERRRRVPPAVERALDTGLDKAIAIQRPAVLAYLRRVQRKQPDLTPAGVVQQLERRYLTAVMGFGAASGGTAALPGVGTAASAATGAAEIAAFISATGMYVLALAELHGVPVSNPQVRRALVLSVLVGDVGALTVEGAATGSAHWAQLLSRASSRDKVAGINARLGHLLLTRFGARQGALLFGRALPFGVGAGVGAVGNAALARTAVSAARRIFGPAPDRFPARVIDGQVVDPALSDPGTEKDPADPGTSPAGPRGVGPGPSG
jgi:hypothetical protein